MMVHAPYITKYSRILVKNSSGTGVKIKNKGVEQNKNSNKLWFQSRFSPLFLFYIPRSQKEREGHIWYWTDVA